MSSSISNRFVEFDGRVETRVWPRAIGPRCSRVAHAHTSKLPHGDRQQSAGDNVFEGLVSTPQVPVSPSLASRRWERHGCVALGFVGLFVTRPGRSSTPASHPRMVASALITEGSIESFMKQTWSSANRTLTPPVCSPPNWPLMPNGRNCCEFGQWRKPLLVVES